MKASSFLAFLILTLCVSPGHAYDWVSVRVLSLGQGLAGYVEDHYTDTYRNPAYLGSLGQERLHSAVSPASISDIGRNFMMGISGSLVDSGSFAVGGAADVWFIQRYRAKFSHLYAAQRLIPDFPYYDSWGPFANRFGGSLGFGIQLGKRDFVGVSVNGGLGRPVGANKERSYYHEIAARDSTAIVYQRSKFSANDMWEDSLAVRIGYLRELSEQSAAELYVSYRWHGYGIESSDNFLYERFLCDLNNQIVENCEAYSLEDAWFRTKERMPNARSLSARFLLWRASGRSRLAFQAGGGARKSEVYVTSSEEFTSWRRSVDGPSVLELELTDRDSGRYDSNERAYYGMLGIGGTRFLGSTGVPIYWATEPWFYQRITCRSAGVINTRTNSPTYTGSAEEHVWYNEYSLKLSFAVEVPVGDYVTLRFGNSSSIMCAKETREIEYPTFDDGTEKFRTESLLWPEGVTEFSGGLGFRLANRLMIDIYSLDISSWRSWKLQSTFTF